MELASNVKTSATSNDNSLNSREQSAKDQCTTISEHSQTEEKEHLDQAAEGVSKQRADVPIYRLVSGIKQRAVFKPRFMPMQNFQNEFNTTFDREQTSLWDRQLAALSGAVPEDNSHLEKEDQSFEQMVFDESFFSFKDFKSNCPLVQGLQKPKSDKHKVFSKKVA